MINDINKYVAVAGAFMGFISVAQSIYYGYKGDTQKETLCMVEATFYAVMAFGLSS